MAKSSEYWKKRFLEIEKASNAYGQDAFRQIEKTFDKAQMDIQKEIERWYGRYAKNNQITMQEAKKQLTARELKELRWDVEEYIKYGRENALDQKWMKELENASARFHISRLEALKIRTQHAAEKAFGNELDQIDGMARHVFTEDYYHSLFEMQKGFGIGWEVGQIDEKKLNTLITKPWAADGKNFSDRVWGNRTALVNELHQQLTRTCILGKAPDDAIKAISKKMNTSKNNAGRLVMTEQAYFHSVAQKEAFKELDVEEFEVVATLDSHTSDICQDMDGQHFPMSQYEPGVTAPPFHVWCRSVTVPYFDDEWGSNGERVARDENGQTYYVPADMKYKDWKDHFVDKTKDPADWLKPTNETKSSIRDIETFSELREYFYTKYDGLTLGADVKNLDFESVLEVLDGVERVMLEFPKAQPYFRRFEATCNIDNALMSANFKGVIKFNPTIFDKRETVLLEHVDTTGFHPKNFNPMQCGAHEAGHILERALLGISNGTLEDWNGNIFARDVITEAFWIVDEKPGYYYSGNGITTIKGTISKYAKTTDGECLAEAVADYISNGEDAAEYSKEIWKILKRELG